MQRPASLAALALSAALAACGDGDGDGLPPGPPPPLATPARVSAGSPFAPGCSGAAAGGVRYAGSEVEPSLSASPLNPDHLVASWQQDRWSNGAADGIVAAVSLDGGISWTRAAVPFSRCGGGAGRGGDFDRATDPWVSFSADGAVVHHVALAVGAAESAILAARSTDGGLTWSDARVLQREDEAALFVDKPSLTADPVDPARAYAVWDRLTGIGGPAALQTGPAWFSRTTDAGLTWEAPRVLHDPGPDAQTIGNLVLVLPDGALLDVFVRILGASTSAPRFDVAAVSSADGGATWSDAVVVGELRSRGTFDPKSGRPIRAGEVVPLAAVDAASGAVHVVWQDARFSGGVHDGIALSTSHDGGATWSAPQQVNLAPAALAFRPAVAVGSGGAVAVTYYDLRNDVRVDPRRLWTTFWRATSTDGFATWTEAPEGGPFDLREAPDAGGLFLGDYTGRAAVAERFVSVFSLTAADGAGARVFATPAPPP
jgi:hypothetical protein